MSDLIAAQPEASGETLLDSLGSVLLSGGRQLVSCEVNGSSVELDDLGKQLTSGMKEDDVLNLITEPLGDSLTRQLEEMGKSLSASEGDLLSISEGLTQEDSSASLEKLSQFLLDLKGMAEAIGQLLNVFPIQDGEDKKISEALKGLSTAFSRIEEGFQKNEVVEMADYVEHDLPGVLARVRDVFPEMAAQIRKGLSEA